VLSAAAVGALAVTLLVMFIAARFENSTVLLIVGLLVGYFIAALISLMIVGSDAEALRVYVSWGMGSFGRLTLDSVWVFALAVLVGLSLVVFSIRYLNAARLGDDFAKGLGVNVRRGRLMVLLGSSLLAAASTAFCGPVAFVGIAVPHITRKLLKSTRPLLMIPAVFLCGAVFCVLSDLAARTLFSPTELSISTVTSVIGAPIVISLMISRRKNREA
jgi:iron complex transport system permease protein